ncbi:hypothetical protein POSPLADRAFT_1128051 [Postia placenta MAD-698-R-SB12]|uniref:Uncharacterized protein n=1 Tax=Postia placenta MAD-698-R-SB12 TaxID=670580 RepID=A0A1X6NGK7_9APHY|nr:hypothetical protein POSPLADRAFT_1128051 [Postia placenta MAD-698-R-SB12]OSX67483.1 hypothetical protein POSPLADRAFT_1128051 [Postia placenta MAD-698-R-SB12]
MSTSAGPSASRGDITLQPSYFTSSLYVEPLREDISSLITLYAQQYSQTNPPFALFKRLWTELGWSWLHFKVFDPRARESFLRVTQRLFLERMVDSEPPLARVVGLFALYTFYFTQPSTSDPSLHALKHIDTTIDLYKSVSSLSETLADPALLPLQPYAEFVLSALIDAQAVLPREIFVEDGHESAVYAALTGEAAASQPIRPPKKKGRPSKRDRVKKAKDALIALEKYADINTVSLVPQPPWPVHSMAGPSSAALDPTDTTHILVAHPPMTTRHNYQVQKDQLLDALYSRSADSLGLDSSEETVGRIALERANEAVLARLKLIDEMAAEKGLEVGGEGGEKTGLTRVASAVRQVYSSGTTDSQRGGVLGLLEGAGLALDIEMGENGQYADTVDM